MISFSVAPQSFGPCLHSQVENESPVNLDFKPFQGAAQFNLEEVFLLCVTLVEVSDWDHPHNTGEKLEPISFLLAAHLILIISCVNHHQLTICWT